MVRAAKELHFNKNMDALKRMQAGADKLATVVGVTLGPKVRGGGQGGERRERRAVPHHQHQLQQLLMGSSSRRSLLRGCMHTQLQLMGRLERATTLVSPGQAGPRSRAAARMQRRA